MNTDKLLSVVIPTYNMEALLPRCLSNLIINDETLFNMLEVLVVIDGATDGSSVIAHQYEQEHPQVFRVIDKENGNYGSCVNRGLAEAKGKYIKVLDADDWFDTAALKVMLKTLAMVDADLVLTDFNVVDEKGSVTSEKRYALSSGTILNTEALATIAPHMAMHAVTYKTENLRRIAYRQTEGISYTDQEWIFRPMTTVKSFYYLNISLYQYLLGREGQTMNSAALFRNMHQNLQVLKTMMGVYRSYNEDVNILKYLTGRLYGYAEYIYSLYLYNAKNTDVAKLICFDKELKYECPDLYRYLGGLKAGKLPFVRLWRIFYYTDDHGLNDFFRYRRYRLFLSK